MLGHSTLRLEDTFGETFTSPGAPLILPSSTPLLDALRTVGAELSAPAVEKPLVKVNSDHAQQIYLHPFTQLAIERGRQRRAAALAGLREEAKDSFEATDGIDTYRSVEDLAEATGIDSARGPGPTAATARGAPAVGVPSGVLLPPVRPTHGFAGVAGPGERKAAEDWSPRGSTAAGGGGAASSGGGLRIPAGSGGSGGAGSGGAASSTMTSRLGLGDAGKQLLHAALE